MAKLRTPGLLAQFKAFFSGSQDKFVIHVPPFKKDSDGKTTAAFVGFAKYGSKSYPAPQLSTMRGEYVPVTEDAYRKHLNGDIGLALSPIIGETNGGQKNVCPYGIIDIDIRDVDFLWLINRLDADGFRFTAFRSKSNGLHIYFRFKKYEPAKDVKAALTRIVKLYGLNKIYKTSSGVSKVEVFPEVEECKPNIKQKCVFLPWFNEVGGSKNKMLMYDGTELGLAEGIVEFGNSATTVADIEATLSSLPYADAPYCVQAYLLSGYLHEGSNRNNFIFMVGIYLKLKHGNDFTLDKLLEANNRLIDPLPEEEVRNTYKSATTTGATFTASTCNKEPIVNMCDKDECRERKFSGVRKDRDNLTSNIEFGRMWRMLAETPYYLIEARLAGSDDAMKVLRLDAAENLLNQKTMQKECIDKLGQIMWTVKQQVWEERLNELMANMVDKKVAAETDTTELSELRQLFCRYLVVQKDRASTPFHITLSQAHYADGKYYFQTDGFRAYLRVSKYILGRVNLREQLISYGCKEGFITHKKRDGSKMMIKCWVKEEDDILREMAGYFSEAQDQDALVIEMDAAVQGVDDEEIEVKF